MGKMFAAAITTGEAITAAEDILFLTAGTNVGCIIHEVRLGQTSLTASEHLVVKLHRGTGGTAGTALTEVALSDAGATATAAVEADRATQSTPADVMWSTTWNVLQEWVWMPTPEMRPTVTGGQTFVVEIDTNPSASMTVFGCIIWEEIG